MRLILAVEKFKDIIPDVLLLDIEMPEMDGLETLEQVKQKYPSTKVIMVSGLNRSSADVTIRALNKGAIDFIPKPESDSIKQSSEELELRLRSVFSQFSASKSSVISKMPIDNGNQQTHLSSKLFVPKKIDVIAMGASTGGPAALSEILSRIPGDIGVPILLVQHMPPVFTASLATSLDKKSALSIKEAENYETVNSNTVYIAPGGQHMTIYKNKESKILIRLNSAPPEHSCRPAVDVLFRSVAETYKKNILSVILTGMGSDGALGVKSIKDVGGYSLTQSEKSCVVYGMPQAVVKMNLSDEEVDLKDIENRITSIVLRKEMKS